MRNHTPTAQHTEDKDVLKRRDGDLGSGSPPEVTCVQYFFFQEVPIFLRIFIFIFMFMGVCPHVCLCIMHVPGA